jgi:hypothetical protein
MQADNDTASESAIAPLRIVDGFSVEVSTIELRD